ncbi:acyl carrier protein [Verrucomicrobiota bacterium]
MQNEIQDWVVKWFVGHNQDQDLVIDVSKDYYECGLLDSFGIIELIEAVENQFSFRFNDGDFQLAEFRTIQGLSTIIEQKIECSSEN